MARAIVYIPPDVPLDGRCAEECEAYIARRDYEYLGIMRDWETVDRFLEEHWVEAVVFVRPNRRRSGRNQRGRFADDVATRKLNDGSLWEKHGAVPSRTPGLTTHEVCLAIYGDMPVQGVNRTTLEAIRWLAAHFRDCPGDFEP